MSSPEYSVTWNNPCFVLQNVQNCLKSWIEGGLLLHCRSCGLARWQRKRTPFFGDIFLAIVTPDSSSCGDFDKLKNATNLLSWVTLTLSLFGSSFFEQKTGGKVPSTLLPSRIQLYQAFTKWREIWYQGLKNLRRQGWLCNAIFLPNAGVLIRVNSPFWKKLPNKQTFCTYCSKH